MSPEVEYARSGGASIAYQVFGAGPPDLVFAPGFVSHLDLAWEEPSLARFLRGLGSFSRVIWFDKVGTGLSDAREHESSLEDQMPDVGAVMDLVPILDELAIPTLLLHRVDDGWMTVDGSRYLAQRIEGARLVELPGIDHWPWIGASDDVLVEIEAFLTGRRAGRRRRYAAGPEALTARERAVARMAAEGHTARAIAERLSISERTAESHMAHVYLKLGINSRVQLARRAAESGL